ncbi:MAG: glycosyltransferase [Candidatus Omnitrophica bacterium]|nr:glycosyltransferase [Candidatus Omnitrophota bacterium]
MTVSIIIATKTWQKNLEECVNRCRHLDSVDFEIIILPDEPIESLNAADLRIIPTGPISPAYKRDIGMQYAKGDILAFIDDDAYPNPDWLKNALENFKYDNIAAVGGPAITPESDTLRQKAGGIIYACWLVSANRNYRYVPKKKRQVDDFPTCNLLVRKTIMQRLGGFDTEFWPGEDTKLCMDITSLDKKIIYDPRVLVYHHRRPVFLAHLRQVANYALHRGYFVKRFPETSFRWSYFVPSIFLICIVIGGMFSFCLPFFRSIYFKVIFLYLFIVLIFSILGVLKEKNVKYLFQRTILSVMVALGIILTHLVYGLYFLRGLSSHKLKEEKR